MTGGSFEVGREGDCVRGRERGLVDSEVCRSGRHLYTFTQRMAQTYNVSFLKFCARRRKLGSRKLN